MLMCWSAAPLYPHSGASRSKNKAEHGERQRQERRRWRRPAKIQGGTVAAQSISKSKLGAAAIRDERGCAFRRDGAPCSGGGGSLRDCALPKTPAIQTNKLGRN